MKEIKKYYPDGQIREHFWVDESDTIQGEYKNWHSNGQLAYHYFYKNGLSEGENKIWYDNGQMWQHCFHKNNLKEGEFKQWCNNGRIWEHCFYHNNKKIDISTYVTDINNITKEEYFLLQITFGYFPIFKYNGKLQ